MRSATLGPPGAPATTSRYLPILAAAVGGLTLFGFLSGIREPRAVERPAAAPHHATDAAAPARSYSQMAAAASTRPASASLGDLKSPRPGVFDPVVRTPEMKLVALEDRARNRAYDGAPPTIPHPVDVQSTAACLACHAEGLRVSQNLATRISHATLTNCTQCHVEQAPVFPPRGDPVENAFAGAARSGPGERASPGAPPVMPHPTWMRETCAACHGLVARPGIRTTHPWLTNCTQCHAPSARLDHVEFGARTP